MIETYYHTGRRSLIVTLRDESIVEEAFMSLNEARIFVERYNRLAGQLIARNQQPLIPNTLKLISSLELKGDKV